MAKFRKYVIKSKVRLAKQYLDHEISYSGKVVGWVLAAPDSPYLSIVYLTKEGHPIDKQALSNELLKMYPKADGEFLLITEHFIPQSVASKTIGDKQDV